MMTTEIQELKELMLEQFATVNGNISGVQEQVTGVQGQINGLQDQVAGVQERVADLQEQVTGVQERVNGLGRELIDVRGELAALREQVSLHGDRLRAMDHRLAGIERQIEAFRQETKAEFREAAGQIIALYTTFEGLEQEYHAITEGLRRSATERAEDRARLEACERELAALRGEIATLRGRASTTSRAGRAGSGPPPTGNTRRPARHEPAVLRCGSSRGAAATSRSPRRRCGRRYCPWDRFSRHPRLRG